MDSRVTMIFNMNTTPTNLANAQVHAGGWSESFWKQGGILATDPSLVGLQTDRARILPASASVVGLRISNYTLTGNKTFPLGSSIARRRFPGNPGYVTDVPQMALGMSAKANGATNTAHFTLRCIPDSQVIGGEYQPTPAFRTALDIYQGNLEQVGWSFLGRDLTKPVQRVLSINAGVVVLDAANGAVVGDYIRFLKVKDTQGNAVTGAYRVTVFAAPATYTIVGLDADIVVLNSGLCRVDSIKLFEMDDVNFTRASVRKIGRPSESYRGRSSRRAR